MDSLNDHSNLRKLHNLLLPSDMSIIKLAFSQRLQSTMISMHPCSERIGLSKLHHKKHKHQINLIFKNKIAITVH